MHTKRKNNTENYKCFSFSCVAFVWILWIFYFDNIKHNFFKKFQVHKMKVFDCSERIFCKYFLFPCNLNSFHYIIHSKVNHCLPPFIVISPFFSCIFVGLKQSKKLLLIYLNPQIKQDCRGTHMLPPSQSTLFWKLSFCLVWIFNSS